MNVAFGRAGAALEGGARSPAKGRDEGGFDALLARADQADRERGEDVDSSPTPSEDGSSSVLEGPVVMSKGGAPERDLPAEESSTESVTVDGRGSERSRNDEEHDGATEPEGEAGAESEVATKRGAVGDAGPEGAAKVLSEARAAVEVESFEAKAESNEQPEVEVEPEVEADLAEATESTEVDAAELDVDVGVELTRVSGSEASGVTLEGTRAASAYESVGRVARGAEVAPAAAAWDAELIEQLRMQQNLRRLADGKLKLSLNEGGERITLTLEERNGTLHLNAKTASRAMADLMTARVNELREALADLGLALGDLEAQADGQGPETEHEAGDDAKEPVRVEAEESQPILYRTKRLILA